jgi:hypothetical protein
VKGIERLRAQAAADPEAAARWEEKGRKIRPIELQAMAWIESIFPPESPTSKARGGKRLAPTLKFKEAVCWILDSGMGAESETAAAAFSEAMRENDVHFFRMMADASEYVRNLPQDSSRFAKCVIAARRLAAAMMGSEGPLPSRGKVIAAVITHLGDIAFPADEKSRWADVMKAARLADLKRDSSARTSVPLTSGIRRRRH